MTGNSRFLAEHVVAHAGATRMIAAAAALAAGMSAGAAAAETVITQKDKAFSASQIRLGHGEALAIRNDDSRTHNIQVNHPRLVYNSGAQEPGETVRIAFPEPGQYLVFCGIHPKMKLRVDAE